MSFGSDPGRDDSSLPPVNMVIPDDARELDRDLIAYRREVRARRRRERFIRLLRPVHGHGAILPLIATCAALSLLAGTMLSLVTISPASAPTVPATPKAAPSASSPVSLLPAMRATGPALAGLKLPQGMFTVDGTPEQVATLRTAAIALIPPKCGCDKALRRLARSAGAARVGLYFVGEGKAAGQIPSLTRRDGMGIAADAADPDHVFSAAYHPAGLTLLLVHSDSAVDEVRGQAAVSGLGGAALGGLTRPGR